MTESNGALIVKDGRSMIFEGWLLKRGSRYMGWNERYFVLRRNILSYYVQRGDVQPKGTYYLTDTNCQISDIYIHGNRQKDMIYCIKVKLSKKGFTSDSGNDTASVGGESGCSAKSLNHVKASKNDDISGSHIRMAGTGGNGESNTIRLPMDCQSSPTSTERNALLVEKEDGLQRHVKQLHEQEILKEQVIMHSQYFKDQDARKKRRKKTIVTGGKIAAAGGAAVVAGVVTAGIGLALGLVVLGAGAAAGGTAVTAEAASSYKNQKSKIHLIIATRDFEAIKEWKEALDTCLILESVGYSTIEATNALFSGDDRGLKSHPSKAMPLPSSTKPPPETHWSTTEGGWAVFLGSGANNLRIFREEKLPEPLSKRVGRALLPSSSLEDRPCPPLKCQLVLNTTALNALLCLMTHNRFEDSSDFAMPNSGQRASFRTIETIDDHSDVIHLVFRPLYLFPSWTKPRDFVLFRLWWLQDDGSYIVCYDSIEHRECPPLSSNVRGTLNAVYTISPPKMQGKEKTIDKQNECLLTAVVQVDPRGWIPTFSPLFVNQGYAEAFGVSALLQMLDIRDAIDRDRFITNDHGPARERLRLRDVALSQITNGDHPMLMAPSTDSLEEDIGYSYDFSYSSKEFHQEVEVTDKLECGFASNPPMLPIENWAEPDANSFRVRGKTYMDDKIKINAGDSIGRLIAVDIVRVEKNFFTGFCAHPSERVQLALERERRQIEDGIESDLAPFFFVINIAVAGHHMVFYYAIDDIRKINGGNGKPESKLAKDFFFGESDEMRHATLKMIPSIVEGNFVVKNAVGSTPVIMGRKVRQVFVRSDRYFEVIFDTCSTSVAEGIVRLSLGYSKTIVVDMGFLIEGNEESTLPEKMLGCVRLKNVEFGPHIRFVEIPQDGVR